MTIDYNTQTRAVRLFLIAIFCLAPVARAQEIQVLHSFQGHPSEGQTPFGGLVQGSDGFLYGTTSSGGAYVNQNGDGYGTVFKIAVNGTLTTLASFQAEAGNIFAPSDRLLQRNNGNFIGTTYFGGSAGAGTVFEIAPSGSLSTLLSFDYSNGAFPYAGLVQGPDGDFYGTTVNGGDLSLNFGSGLGTVFKMTAAGALTTLVRFNGANGANPYGGLVQGTDGNFYGTTGRGGGSDKGTVFRMTPDGTLTTLTSFTGANGAIPRGRLVQSPDGSFYGTTAEGGNNEWGTVFRITADGPLTTLIAFNQINGANPYAGLVLGSDGSFYGTTLNGGTNVYDGTVFQMTASGSLSTVASFHGSNGRNPFCALVEGTDGKWYGTTSGGGASDRGTVFRFTPVTTPVCVPATVEVQKYVGVTTFGTSECSYNLEWRENNGNNTPWNFLASVTLPAGPYIDPTPLPENPGARFYRAVSSGDCAPAALEIHKYFGLTITGTVGCSYRIEWRHDEGNDTPWIALQTIILPSSTYLYIDPTSLTDDPGNRFYRVVEPQ
jgi:uncharacterized repeat protein (TIGR03803 family)